MASTTTDRQSFMINGRRIWLVAGTIPYARLPRDLWAPRIRAARDAGLNCIETPVIWGLHETREGAFDFEGDLDLGAYIDLIGQAGMHAIVRLGPYVGPGWDLGGIPAWLAPEAAGKLRSSAPEFLGHCARYISAVCAQIIDRQISVSRKGKTGPIILVQNEHQWFCGDPKEGAAYLGELDRYIRESGMTTPIINTNNLYHVVEGEITAWTARDQFHSTTRQLHAVEPEHPAIAVVPASTVRATWGEPWGSAPPTGSLMRALAEVLASGGQYILKPFHAGPLLGFAGGRYADGPSAFATADPEPDAPLDVSGTRTARYDEVRRISMFASHFGRVLANMDPEFRPVVVGLEPTPSLAGKPAPGSVTAVDCRGSQGSIVFVFAPPEGLKGTRMIWLTLDDGSQLPVTLGADPVGWVLRDVHLVERATLDHCNLSVVGLVGTVLVCYGPAGAPGLLSINGSSFEVDVPKGATPTVVQHEGITLVVCNEKTINQVAFASDAVHLGSIGVDDDGAPIRHPRAKNVKSLSARGEEIKGASGIVEARKGSVAIRSWSCADCSEYVEGSAGRFASIDGPTTMVKLGAASGYGWLRLQLRSGVAQKVMTSFHESGDRLHLYMGGTWRGIAGVGPGADGHLVEMPLKKGEQTLSILVDNLGRLSEGVGLGESKGLFGHLWQVAPLRTGAGKIQTGEPLAPLSVRSPIFGLELHDVTDSDRLTWTITHRKKAPIYMTIDHDPGPGVVLVNDEVVHVLSPGGGDRLVLDVEHQLKRGVNVIQIAITGDMAGEAAALKKSVRLYEGKACLSDKARWSFAKWEQPAPARFKDMPKGKMTPAALGKLKGRPHWWRGEFSASGTETPLFFDAGGLSKGQLFLNGKNVGRYFVASHTGKATPPQTRYYLPDSWIYTDKPNELVIFDEHGFAPAKAKLVYGSSAEVA